MLRDKAILVVSFGTSFNESRKRTIEAVERAVAERFEGFEVRRAFTSGTIIRLLRNRDGVEVDDLREALKRLAEDGCRVLVVQPTFVMSGFEYDDMMGVVREYEGLFERVGYGKPLLSSAQDYDRMAGILAEEANVYAGEGTGVVFMGHGTEHEANCGYGRLSRRLETLGFENCIVGTMGAKPSLEDVMAKLEGRRARRVVLLPLMIVAGSHAARDMAGDQEGSWKYELEAKGYNVTCVIKGLGEYEKVRDMFVSHVQDVLDVQDGFEDTL